jgi:putative transposase
VLWKLLLVAERRFRRLNSPELLKEVFAGVQYVDGVRARSEEAAA